MPTKSKNNHKYRNKDPRRQHAAQPTIAENPSSSTTTSSNTKPEVLTPNSSNKSLLSIRFSPEQQRSSFILKPQPVNFTPSLHPHHLQHTTLAPIYSSRHTPSTLDIITPSIFAAPSAQAETQAKSEEEKKKHGDIEDRNAIKIPALSSLPTSIENQSKREHLQSANIKSSEDSATGSELTSISEIKDDVEDAVEAVSKSGDRSDEDFEFVMVEKDKEQEENTDIEGDYNQSKSRGWFIFGGSSGKNGGGPDKC